MPKSFVETKMLYFVENKPDKEVFMSSNCSTNINNAPKT